MYEGCEEKREDWKHIKNLCPGAIFVVWVESQFTADCKIGQQQAEGCSP